MGHSSSSPTRSAYDADLPVSKPSPLRRQVSATHLNSSTHGSQSRSLAPPQAQGHRRTRSARAANPTPSVNRNAPRERPSSYVPPPPPYSVAVATPPENVGSSHTHVYMATPNTMPAPSTAMPLPNTSVPSGSNNNRRPNRSNTYLRTPMRRETIENALETLRKFDTVIIVDDSGSMAGALWEEAGNALASLADVAGQYDADGVDIHFLNCQTVGRNMSNMHAVKELFRSVQPRGTTPIGEKLEILLLDYLLRIEEDTNTSVRSAIPQIKPVNFLVITDGAPTDDPESVIVAAARRLDKGNFPMAQVGIQFVQVGQSQKAREFLQELDDNLGSNHSIRDIVDTTPYIGAQLTADVLTKILLGGINRRVDKRGASAVTG